MTSKQPERAHQSDGRSRMDERAQEIATAISLMKRAMASLDKADERGNVAVHLQAALDAAEDKSPEQQRAEAVSLRRGCSLLGNDNAAIRCLLPKAGIGAPLSPQSEARRPSSQHRARGRAPRPQARATRACGRSGVRRGQPGSCWPRPWRR
jgi:hypothetical protein